MKNNYSVYQHVTPDGMYYFGATSNIKRRWRCNGIQYKETSLYPYIEKFGWDNIQHIVLFKEQTRENALWIENFLIETAQEDGVCINKKRSGLISKEEGYQQQYYEQNKDKKKQYREKNKDSIREYQQEYCQKTKDKKKDYDKQYYEKNKDKKKQYYETNKDKKREYNRQYYQRKKLEKQLKEVEIPLF